MRNRTSVYKTHRVKNLFAIVFFAVSITGVIECDAQSVIGKWERTGTKIFVSEKSSGKQVPASSEMQQKYDKAIIERGYKEIIEFKSGSTYVSTVTAAGKEPMIHDGNYSLSGKDLNMNIPLVNNEKTTITIQSLTNKTMIWDMVFMGKLTELIYSKI